MSRMLRLYKRLLDTTLLISYGLLILLVFLLLFGVYNQAFNFEDMTQPIIRAEYSYLRTILIFLVASIIIFVVAARVFLSFIEGEHKLQTADDYRQKMGKSTSQETKNVAFSETQAYKNIKDKEKATVLKAEPKDSSALEEDYVDDFIDDFEDEEYDSKKKVKEKPKQVVKEEVQPVESKIIKVKPIKEKEYYTRRNKTELIEIVAKASNISKAKSRVVVNTLLDTIKNELVAGNDVKIEHFGKFESRLVKEKQSRNPQTGRTITVPEHNQVKFTAYKKFKDDITNDVIGTNDQYLLTKTVAKNLSEDQLQEELIEEEKAIEHVENTLRQEVAKKPVVKKQKPTVPKKTKKDIIEYIASNTMLSKNKANKFLKSFSEVVKEQLFKKEDVSISGFGHFTTVHIPSKEAVNPSTKEKITVPEHDQIRLRFEKSFKDKFKQK